MIRSAREWSGGGLGRSTPREQQSLREIEAILFPGGVSNTSERNDVEIVFNARKYSCILVTADGASRTQPRGILGSRAELRCLGIEILTDREAVERIHRSIARQDERAREQCLRTGEPLPSWVGND